MHAYIHIHMGGCQNSGPFLDPYYNTAPKLEGTQPGAIMLTTTPIHIHIHIHINSEIYIHIEREREREREREKERERESETTNKEDVTVESTVP